MDITTALLVGLPLIWYCFLALAAGWNDSNKK